MKGKHNLATRLGGGFLAAIMLLSILPISTIAMAVGSEKDVTVTWTPSTQTEDGTRTVTLTAQLTQSEGAPAAAMVEISLTDEETAALSWPADKTINESDLATSSGEGTDTDTNTPDTEGSQESDAGTTQEPDTGDPQESDPETSQDPSAGQQEADGTEPSDSNSDTGETDTPPATVTAAQSRTAGEQAVLIKKTDGRAVLRILLSGTTPYTQPLIFTASGSDLNVDVDEDDILVKTYAGTEGESAPTSIGAGSGVKLLTATDTTTTNALDFTGTSFTVLQTVPDEVAITTSGESVSLDGEGSKDITYNITVQKPADSEGKEYTFTLTWPSKLTRPSGTLEFEQDDTGGYITSDNKQLATLSTKDTGVTINGLTATDSGLSFVVKVPQATQSVDVELSEVTLTVDGSVFERSATAFSENMTLSTINSTEETISASVPVTAGDVALPGGDAGYTVVAVNRNDTLEQTVGWADGNNEAHLRPDWSLQSGKNTLTPHLYFTIDGVTWELTKENMAAVGLTEKTWPEIIETPSGFTVTGLPSRIQEVSTYDKREPVDVTWSLAPPDTAPAGYAFVNVTKENKDQYSSVTETGWYYMLESQFTFTVEVKKGANKELESAQVEDILSNFEFRWEFTNGNGSEGIMDMVNDPSLDTNFAFEGTDSEGNHRNLVTITGLWKYNLDGSPISYRVAELADNEESSGDYKLDKNELGDSSSLLPDEEDWLQVLCDNSGVPNHSTDTNAVYNGGKLQLILSGETTFSAEKRWLDEKPDGGLDSRPDVTFTLWRYQENYSYNTAAQVPDVKMKLDSGMDTTPDYNEDEGYYYYPVTFTNPDSTDMTFPKYTADGYAYIYGVKEEMSSGGYEQLYEVVDDTTGKTLLSDILPYSGDRAAGDNLLYQDGTLSNRLTGSVQVSATKQWDAAAYQSEFADVAVELTLRSKLKDDGSSQWEDVVSDGKAVKRYLYNFTAERLTESCTAYMPKYDAQGKELEYQWVETAVYQNFGDPGAGQTAEDMVNTAIRINIDPDNGSFTLEQKETQVTYYSTVEEDGTIVNRIDDNIQYNVEKQWEQGTTEQPITINLYQYTTSIDLTKKYVSFSFDKDGTLIGAITQVPANSEITVSQAATGDWKAVVNNLPRYDESGHPYSYLLLEETGFPEYTTTQDANGNYTTIVVNGSGGEAIPILIQKVWLDGGDELHREPVTFTIYNRKTNRPVKNSDGSNYTVTLGGKDSPGLWFQVVKVPMDQKDADGKEQTNGVYDIDDLYVVETKVGDTEVEYYSSSLSYANLYKDNWGQDEHIFDVTTENHRYQVTYDYEASAGRDAGGVQGTFTVTNRRLGNIDLTVNKTWVNGVGDGEDARKLIADELEELANDGIRLALAFRLVFADESKTENTADNDGWGITYTGIDGAADYVQVGGESGEKVFIHDINGDQASSDQVIIGVMKDDTTATYANSFHFFGLPKYDAQGKVVEYTVEEVWLNVTTATSENPPQLLTEEELAQYSDLYNLWKEYNATYETTYVANDNEKANTHDTQTINWTNTRAYTKTVQWQKEWKDNFAHNNDLRPDIYLDVYRVIHVEDDGQVKEQIQQVMADLKWAAEDDNSWTVTLAGVQKYDALGYEITYYAVEHTVAAAGDYDYQAAKYSIKDGDGNVTELGTRDEPTEDAETNGQVVDLLKNTLWANGVPSDLSEEIGTFENGGSARYALVEGGTFTNTLADVYTIEGMKYWTSLPTGWPAANLPSVTFYVHQYTEDSPPSQDTLNSNNSNSAIATLTVDDWTLAPMKTGLGYRYLIQYEGKNTLSVENGQLVCKSQDSTPTPLPRYDESGKLYHYLVVEEVNWDENNKPDEGDRVFTTSCTDFTVTNEYNPTTGSVKVSYDGLNIVNRKEDAVGALRVTKQVTGTGAEYDRAFSFTVTLEDRTINGTYGEMTFVDGVATFTLRHGQSVTAVGLPAGIPYTVTETVPEGYAASNAQQAGEIPASDLATVTVVNHRDLPEEPTNPEDPEGPENPDVPDSPDDPAGPEDPQGPEVQTGDRANLTLYGGLAALFAAGLAVTLYWGKKEDRKKDDR